MRRQNGAAARSARYCSKKGGQIGVLQQDEGRKDTHSSHLLDGQPTLTTGL